MTGFTRAQRIAALHDEVTRRLLIIDGAMGTMVQTHGLKEADYRNKRFKDWARDLKKNNDLLILTRPDVVDGIHRQYLEAGADIIETATFNSTRISMADYGMQAIVRELNVEGARLARTICDEFESKDGRPRWVAGVLGPLNRTASLSPDVNDPGARSVALGDLRGRDLRIAA